MWIERSQPRFKVKKVKLLIISKAKGYDFVLNIYLLI